MIRGHVKVANALAIRAHAAVAQETSRDPFRQGANAAWLCAAEFAIGAAAGWRAESA
mgnify:CR=1 FL=1